MYTSYCGWQQLEIAALHILTSLVKQQLLLSLVRQQKAAAVLFRCCTELQGPFNSLPFTLHAWLCELLCPPVH